MHTKCSCSCLMLGVRTYDDLAFDTGFQLLIQPNLDSRSLQKWLFNGGYSWLVRQQIICSSNDIYDEKGRLKRNSYYLLQIPEDQVLLNS